MDYKDKKVLVFGLGILGGGVATTNWLISRGARVTVTDLKTEEKLKPAVDKINGEVVFILGGHSKDLIDQNDIIVVNPDVSIENEFVKYALDQGKSVTNEAIIFFEEWNKNCVGVTGTRGKTTTSSWINYFLNLKFRSSLAGNSGENPFLGILSEIDNYDVAVAEVPSFHLEFADPRIRPSIAVITNVYRDHLNRHKTAENYARIKANLFINQTADDHVILNVDNEWTDYFIKLNPKSRVWYFSTVGLAGGLSGVFYKDRRVYFRDGSKEDSVLDIPGFVKEKGEHNLANLLASSLAAYLAGVDWNEIQKGICDLPQIKFRQEIVYKNEKLTIINDTTATSPEAGMEAVKRFGSSSLIMISGGTDRELDFGIWGKVVSEFVISGNLILFEGSATEKMIKSLPVDFKYKICNDLESCFKEALDKSMSLSDSVILFSPSSKSFEKFNNEFDRGNKFNAIVDKVLNRG